jgi:hypothetical protein
MLVRFAAQGAQSEASAASSSECSDSYNGDDTRRYLHERDEALGHCWEVAQEAECLGATLTASQTTLVIVEGESSAIRARLAEFDARVIVKIFRRNPIPLVTLLHHALLDDLFHSYYSLDGGIESSPSGG